MPRSAWRRLITRPNSLPGVPEPFGDASGLGAVLKVATAEPPCVVGVAIDAEVWGRGVGTAAAVAGVSRTALAAAAALHAACLAGTLFLVHSPPAAPPVEQAVQMTFEPPAATPIEAEAAVVTEPEAVSPSEPASPAPETASAAPEAALPKPTAAVTPEQPDVPPSPEPVAAPAVAAAQTVEAREEQPAEPPGTSAVVIPPVPPALPPAQPQPHSATHHVTPRVVSSRGDAPVHVPQQSNAIATGESATVRREAIQGSAQDADQEAKLEARIRDAVQAAVHYPVAARMMDITGRARVQLDYRNGVVDSPLLARSSGTPMLDQAALNAAQTAHYPATPVALAGRLMRFLVWVEFRVG